MPFSLMITGHWKLRQKTTQKPHHITPWDSLENDTSSTWPPVKRLVNIVQPQDNSLWKFLTHSEEQIWSPLPTHLFRNFWFHKLKILQKILFHLASKLAYSTSFDENLGLENVQVKQIELRGKKDISPCNSFFQL